MRVEAGRRIEYLEKVKVKKYICPNTCQKESFEIGEFQKEIVSKRIHSGIETIFRLSRISEMLH